MFFLVRTIVQVVRLIVCSALNCFKEMVNFCDDNNAADGK